MKTPTLTEGGELPTPRTDSEVIDGGNTIPGRQYVRSFFARALERELASQSELARNRLALWESAEHQSKNLLAQAAHHSAQLEKALGRIAQLEGALRGLMAGSVFKSYDQSPPCWQSIQMPTESALNVARALLHPDSPQ
jgi:hypothetical protein